MHVWKKECIIFSPISFYEFVSSLIFNNTQQHRWKEGLFTYFFGSEFSSNLSWFKLKTAVGALLLQLSPRCSEPLSPHHREHEHASCLLKVSLNSNPTLPGKGHPGESLLLRLLCQKIVLSLWTHCDSVIGQSLCHRLDFLNCRVHKRCRSLVPTCTCRITIKYKLVHFVCLVRSKNILLAFTKCFNRVNGLVLF